MKSVKLNFIFNIIKTVMAILFPVITFPYVSRVLGVANIGKVQYCQSVISYFSLFAGLGIALYAVREGAKVREDRYALSKLSSELFILNMITTGISYVVLMIMIFWNAFDQHLILLLVNSLTIILTTLSIEWLYQIEEDYAYISFRSMIFQAIAIALMFVFVRDKGDYVNYAFLCIFSSLGYFFLNLIHAKKYIDLSFHYHLEIKKHLKPVLSIFGVTVAASIYINMDSVMLGIIHSDYEVGLYAVAVKINNIIKQIASAVSIVAVSRLSVFENNNQSERFEALVKNSLNLNLSFLVPCALGLFMLSGQVISIFSGNDYLSADLASKILSINVIFSAVDGLIYNQVMIPKSLERYACFATIIGGIINIILNFSLIPAYGINGASIATLISEVSVFVIFIWILKDYIRVRHIFNQSYKFIIASIPIIPIYYLVLGLISNSLLVCIVTAMISVVVYLIILYLLKMELLMSLIHEYIPIIKRRLGR